MKNCWRQIGWPVAIGLVLGLATEAQAAQMVALDMKATGGVKQALADTLTPILVTELSRRQGMSVISQGDVLALLEHDARKQELGCSDTSCLTDLAGSLGAELLLTSSIGRVGRKWLVTLTMVEVERAKVFRRVTGEQTGAEEAAAEAVAAAVHNLFRDGLPEELQGPASMSYRGFRAALLGLGKVIRDPRTNPIDHRRRIILDLVNTELDYDAKPKIEELDLFARRQYAGLDEELLIAKDAEEFAHKLRAMDSWRAVRRDIERVKEIRTRARERGVEPTGRPLRFEEPDPPEWPEEAKIADYKKALKPGQEVVTRAMKAFSKRDQKGFLKHWTKDNQSQGERFFENQFAEDKRYGYTYKMVPAFAISPYLLSQAVDKVKEGDLVVYLAQFKKGAIYSEDRVYLKLVDGRWLIRGW